MLPAPPGSVVTASMATPLLFRVPVPSAAVPFRKVTVPVGLAPEPLRAAVKVTDAPYVTVAADEVSRAVGVILVTMIVCEIAAGE